MARFLTTVNNNRRSAARLRASPHLSANANLTESSGFEELYGLGALMPHLPADNPNAQPILLMLSDLFNPTTKLAGVVLPAQGIATILGRGNTYTADMRRDAMAMVMLANRKLAAVPNRFVLAINRLREELLGGLEVTDLSWEEIALQLGMPELGQVVAPPRARGLIWAVSNRAHLVPWTKLPGTIMIEFFNCTTVPTANNVNQGLDTVLGRQGEDLLTAWKTLSYEELLGCYTYINTIAGDDALDLTAASVTLLTMSLAKSNVTPVWVQRRVISLIQSYQRTDVLATLVSAEAVRATRLYMCPESLPTTLVLSNLLFYYQTLNSRFPVLGRIIEQARAANCAGLSALAGLVVKNPIATHTVLSNCMGLEGDLVVAIEGMIRVIVNPYGTLVTPPVPSSRYPDLAYVVTASLVNPNAPNAFQRNEESTRVTRSIGELKAWIIALRQAESKDGASELNMQAIARAYGFITSKPDAVGQFQARVPQGPLVHADDEGVNVDLEVVAGAERDFSAMTFREASNQAGSRILDAKTFIREHQNARDVSLLALCRMYNNAVAQKMINGAIQVAGILPTQEEKTQLTNLAHVLNVPGIAEDINRVVDLIRPTEIPADLTANWTPGYVPQLFHVVHGNAPQAGPAGQGN